MKERKPEARCPCCKGKIEYFPDQDGSCDFECTRCGWHQHIPSQKEIQKAKRREKPVR
jgi:hypothetical protein